MIRIKAVHANRGFWNELFSAKGNFVEFDNTGNAITDDITKKGRSWLWRLSQLRILDLLGIYQTVKVKTEDDIVLSYNRFINSNVPYVIAVENPVAMVHYHPKRARSVLGKMHLKKTFANKNLKAIVCLSDACMEGLNKYYQIPNRIMVKRIYPYVNEPVYVEDKNIRDKDVLECLFVSSNFNLKGGAELLEAIYRNNWINDIRIHFSIITKLEELSENVKTKLDMCKSVSVYDYNFSKTELNKFYDKADVLLHLTRMDSFPLVVLEAIKHGCAIIATDMYAIGEMVENDINGFLCETISGYWNKDYTLNELLTKKDKASLYSDSTDELIVSFVSEKISYLLSHREKVEEMKSRSIELAQGKFSSEYIMNEWKAIFMECLKGVPYDRGSGINI